MRILFVSQELIGSGLCNRLQREGHDIKLYINDPCRKKCLDGIIPKTKNWRGELTWVGKNGLIIFDDVGFGKAQNKLRKDGFAVVGGSEGGDKLELDRSYFQEVVTHCGIKTPKTFSFNSCIEAIDFVDKNPGKWVVKQSTHISMLNYVGESSDGQDVIGLLSVYDTQGITKINLQERVSGLEVGVARYFNGIDWVGPIEINHEHKKLCNDDIGPLTAEMGTVMWYSTNENIKLFTEALAPLKEHLQSIDFRGDIDINCIINGKNIWVLEATPRFGTPSTQLQSELYVSSMADFLFSVATRSEIKVKQKKEYGVVISIALPPFPYPPASTSIKNTGGVICDFSKVKPSFWDHIYLEEISKQIQKNGREIYTWAGEFGYALYVTGSGDTISKARDKCDTILKTIVIPKMIYRTDIGKKVESNDLAKLKSWGWL